MAETPAWLWLNLLGMDAPAVALVWQDLAARTFGAPLHPAARLVLGLTVWAVYLSDRLLDIRKAGPAPDTPRHEFARRHGRGLCVLLAAVLVLDGFVAVVDLRRAVFLYGLAIAGGVASYLSTFPHRASGWEKQVMAAILFSAGVLVAPGAGVGLFHLLLPAALFAGLCLCNLVLIELWEGQRRDRLVWLAPAAVAGVAIFRPAGAWQDAVALSAALLAVVAIRGPRLTVDAKRVLADAVLLTPLLFR